MKLRSLLLAAAGFAIGITGITETDRAYADELFFPVFVYRTGPYAPSGEPIANGFRDYYALLNKRDGGIEGLKVKTEECETKYNTKVGVECYEKLKNKHGGALLVNPYSTGLTYQLIPKAAVDNIPIISMGYGRTAAADGRVFKWVFNFPATYWSQASAFVNYVGDQEGGMANLKGKHIAHVHHNSAYGKEANPTLDTLSKKFGFKLTKLAVDHPGQEQKATWLQIRRKKPDWVFMSGWGVMNQVAIKEAATIGFPMDRFVGNWWSGSDADVVPAGDNSIGYKSTAMHSAGVKAKVMQDIIKHVYGGDKAAAKTNKVGEVLYNRGVYNAALATEAVRDAVKKSGGKKPNGDQVRAALESFTVDKDRLAKLGMSGFANPVSVSCRNHEGAAPGVFIQQWDGKQWKVKGDFVPAMSDVVRPMVEKAAAAYAKENNIKPRGC
ncbi:MAG: ABC transporter permease [Rhodospirillaceae bacterium TMED8]|nr:ABC transporter permease [Magnetovibrio sp.]OUT52167.1 MAG: ABC transporter permease [Rhodospirillaceae bacterium TMED8]